MLTECMRNSGIKIHPGAAMMLAAYIEAALFSSNDESTPEGGEPFDSNYDKDDISDETQAVMLDDVLRFLNANAEDIGTDFERAGHDFWLTRNHHGAGFWDGDWPEPAATRLTDAAHAFGEANLYLGDDGRIYL